MSVRRLSQKQPDSFAFTADNMDAAKSFIAKYPDGKKASAVISLLWMAQKQNNNWLTEPAIRYVADMLDMAYIRVLEVATFYTMFNLEPVGEYFIQLCGTTPCWLRGADDLKHVCRKVIGEQSRITDDGKFSWLEVECLGACANAPLVQINDYYYEDLDASSFENLLVRLRNGEKIEPGSMKGRQCSMPEGGATTLIYSSPKDIVVNSSGDSQPSLFIDNDLEGKKSEAATKDYSVSVVEDEEEPELFTEANGLADDLTKISGVGPKLSTLLNELGVFHFSQIASWNREHVAWVDNRLKFKGRIDRDNWIEQAKKLAREVK